MKVTFVFNSFICFPGRQFIHSYEDYKQQLPRHGDHIQFQYEDNQAMGWVNQIDWVIVNNETTVVINVGRENGF